MKAFESAKPAMEKIAENATLRLTVDTFSKLKGASANSWIEFFSGPPDKDISTNFISHVTNSTIKGNPSVPASFIWGPNDLISRAEKAVKNKDINTSIIGVYKNMFKMLSGKE